MGESVGCFAFLETVLKDCHCKTEVLPFKLMLVSYNTILPEYA